MLPTLRGHLTIVHVTSIERSSGALPPRPYRWGEGVTVIMKLGLMLPLGRAFAADEPKRIEQALTFNYTSLWVQEWPVGVAFQGGYRDHGTGYDPFVYGMHLGHQYGSRLDSVGFAVIRSDYRPPSVTARAVVSAQKLGGCSLHLGLGARTNSPEAIVHAADRWNATRAFLHAMNGSDAFALPPHFSAPSMYQPSGNLTLWQAISYQAEGWLTNRLLPQEIEELAIPLRQHIPHLEITLQLFCLLDTQNHTRLEMTPGHPLSLGKDRLRDLLGCWRALGINRIIYSPARTPTIDQLRMMSDMVGEGGTA
jgi:hypothetical protein